MTKYEYLEKGVFWIVKQCPDYNALKVIDKINIRSEVAYYWFNKFDSSFHKHIRPIPSLKKNRKHYIKKYNNVVDLIITSKYSEPVEDFIFQEYLFSVGL